MNFINIAYFFKYAILCIFLNDYSTLIHLWHEDYLLVLSFRGVTIQLLCGLL